MPATPFPSRDTPPFVTSPQFTTLYTGFSMALNPMLKLMQYVK